MFPLVATQQDGEGASGGGRGPERQRRPPSQEPGKGDNMGRTPEEIIKGLECCSISYADCNNECPYKRDCDGSQILKDAIALIQQLAQSNAQLAIGKAILAAENSAMLDTLKRMAHCGGVCVGCVHMDDEPTIIEHCEDLDFDCEKCPTPCACHSCKEGSNYT